MSETKREVPVALLQVREAARALGVHENTLRRWEEAGYINAVRLPSGVRRFREEDVMATRASMYEGLPALDNSDELTPVTAESID